MNYICTYELECKSEGLVVARVRKVTVRKIEMERRRKRGRAQRRSGKRRKLEINSKRLSAEKTMARDTI